VDTTRAEVLIDLLGSGDKRSLPWSDQDHEALVRMQRRIGEVAHDVAVAAKNPERLERALNAQGCIAEALELMEA
jgi:hypothetical protein